MNGMMYIRGSREDFDGWARDYGASGWSYEEVLPYFIKSEDNLQPDKVIIVLLSLSLYILT